MNEKMPLSRALTEVCWNRLSVLLLFLAFIVLTGSPATAGHDSGKDVSPFNQSIMVAGSENTAFNLRFMDLLRSQLGETISIQGYSEPLSQSHPDTLVVTLGSTALAQVQQQSPRPPTLALMTEELQFENYLDRPGRPLSAVYYDAPLLRQALLGKLILPQASQIALLVRPGFETHYDDLIQALRRHGLDARVFTVPDEGSLIAALSRALSYGDFLLATPDPAIYNPRTIKHILLTAYRRNRIVIGPGKAFVRAGVLASTYTPLEAVAESAVEQIRSFLRTGELAPPFHPRGFEIEINRQVAHSLNLPVQDTAILKDTLQQLLNSTAQRGERQ